MPDDPASNEAVATQEPPIAVSDAELERLLDEATSLSQEFSAEVKEATSEASSAEGSAPEEPVAQGSDAADGPESPIAAEQTKPLPDLLQDPDAPTDVPGSETEAEPTATEGAVPETSEPQAQPRPPVKIETRDEEMAKKAESLELAEEESGESEEAQEEEGQPKPSVKERLVASCRLVARIALAVPIGVANGFLTIFILLDRPFSNVSPGLKRVLGLVALATLLAGIAAWVLPDMMNSNPFAEMEQNTKIKG